jgi:hypothetical protein
MEKQVEDNAGNRGGNGNAMEQLMKRPERETTPEILKWLNDHNVMAWRVNSGMVKRGSRWIRMAPEGTPDIQCILPGGKALFIENKSNGSVVSDEQVQWIIRATRQGAHVIVALKGLEDVVDYFEMVIK